MKRRKSKAEADLGHVAKGYPETPLANAFFAQIFYDPECEPLLRCVLGKELVDRDYYEHVAFSGFLIGVFEQALRGDLDELAAELQKSVGGLKPLAFGGPAK